MTLFKLTDEAKRKISLDSFCSIYRKVEDQWVRPSQYISIRADVILLHLTDAVLSDQKLANSANPRSLFLAGEDVIAILPEYVEPLANEN